MNCSSQLYSECACCRCCPWRLPCTAYSAHQCSTSCLAFEAQRSSTGKPVSSSLLPVGSCQCFMQPSAELSQGSCNVPQTMLTVPGLCSQDTVAALKIARALREQGRLPSTLSLWAVSNPLRDPPDSLLQKVLHTALHA